MNMRKTRAMLWLGTACLFVAAGGIVGLHVAFPPEIVSRDNGGAVQTPVERGTASDGSGRIDPDSLQRVASKDIRQQLFDPPVQAPKPQPPKPMPPIELVSTILGDNGQHRAWVRDGQTLRKIVRGDTLGTTDNPAVVEVIAVDHLVIRHEGKQVEVIQQSASGGRR